jgi:hypothetical protein
VTLILKKKNEKKKVILVALFSKKDKKNTLKYLSKNINMKCKDDIVVDLLTYGNFVTS